MVVHRRVRLDTSGLETFVMEPFGTPIVEVTLTHSRDAILVADFDVFSGLQKEDVGELPVPTDSFEDEVAVEN